MCEGRKMSPTQRQDIDRANNMEPVDFRTKHGSQGVTNPNYAEYVKLYPDLMANYNANWGGKGVSLAEYGAMHWNSAGRAEGRTMPGIGGGGGSEPSGGGFSRGLIETGDGLGPYPAYNKYFPMLTTAYEAPGFQDFSAYMTPGVFSGNGGALYQPWAGREFSYTPPQFSVGPVQYYAPVNPLEIIFEEEMSEESSNDSNKNIVDSDSHLPYGSQGGVPDAFGSHGSGLSGEYGGPAEGGVGQGIAAGESPSDMGFGKPGGLAEALGIDGKSKGVDAESLRE